MGEGVLNGFYFLGVGFDASGTDNVAQEDYFPSIEHKLQTFGQQLILLESSIPLGGSIEAGIWTSYR